MSERLPSQVKAASTPSFTPARNGLLQRKCVCGDSAGLTGECTDCNGKRLTVQHYLADHAEPSTVPSIVNEVLRSAGHPLDQSVRSFVEPRFGQDFSQVRIHTDKQAAESARAVNALAYTIGRDMVFGAGQYAPETGMGRELLKHELTHVVQQQTTGRQVLARQPASQPLEQLETTYVKLDPAIIEKQSGAGYWWHRIFQIYEVKWGNYEASERFKDDEERDAVLAALWQAQPSLGTLKSEMVKYVSIPPLADPNKQRGALLYRIVFTPKPADQAKDKIEIFFEMEHPTSVTMIAENPTPDYKPPSFIASGDVGFPDGAEKYWEQHQDEQKQLYYWIQKQGVRFKQVVTTKTTEQTSKGASGRDMSFRVEGNKNNKGEIKNLLITFLGATQPIQTTPSPDYHSKDTMDAILQEKQEQIDPAKQDHLGTVTLGSIPAEEAFSVKYAIWNYFQVTGTRNAEVDTVIPIAGTKKRVFYTLRFRPNNDVDVERVGEEGQEAKLDPNRLDIARVHGYESNADEPKKLKLWLLKRYPTIKPTGQTVVELRESANKVLQTEVSTPGWFKGNYHIHILDAAQGKTRLEQVHKLKKVQTADMKTYTPDELKLIEFSLEPMSKTILSQLNEVRMTRQKISIDDDEKSGTFVPNPKWSGKTHTYGGERTVNIFDSAIRPDSLRFLGGASGVRPASSETFAHEFGHVVEGKTGARNKFNEFIKEEGIQPFTRYAGEKPKQEFFAEAFYIYETDSEWMKSNHPQVYEWFETLSKTGTPPIKKKKK